MAQASALREGQIVTVNEGPFINITGKVINPTVVPDGQENQRKVLVHLDNEVGEVYILPRQLDLGYRTVDSSLATAALSTVHGAIPQVEPITDPMDPALDRFRPNANIVKKYVSRKVPNGMTDVDFLLSIREQRDDRGYSPNIALVGETQSGKTMLVQVLAVVAAEREGLPKPYPVFTLSGSSGVTNYDLFGQTTAVQIDGRETLVWMDGLVPMAVACGAFLYLDEWNAVSPSQAVALHPLLDDRRQFVNTQKAVPDGHGGWSPAVVEAHPKTWVISTINPGYKGTQTMAEATSNRFRWLPWDYDADTEKILIPSTTVRLMAEALRQARLQRTISLPIGTSVLQRFLDDCVNYGVDTAVWIFLGLFPPTERTRVETILEDRGIVDLLRAEYPNEDVADIIAEATSGIPDSTL